MLSLFSRTHFVYPLFVMLLIACFPFRSQACDRSELVLDNVVQVGTEYDIYVSLSIGGGLAGSIQGADNNTPVFAFGFWSSTVNPINFSFFTPSVTSDSTNATAMGMVVFTPPFGTQGMVVYQPLGINYTCITSTNLCGRPHTQIDQYRFRTNVLPDSMAAFGIEGSGSINLGCTGARDMVIDFRFSPFSTPVNITCPPNQQLTNCVFDDYTGLATVTDSTDPNPVVTQQPPAGSTPFGSATTVTLFATNNSMQSVSVHLL